MNDIHQNSIEAYGQLIATGGDKTQQERIVQLLSIAKEPLTRQQVAEILEMRVASATARIKELLELGTIEECGNAKNPETGKQNARIRLARRNDQTQRQGLHRPGDPLSEIGYRQGAETTGHTTPGGAAVVQDDAQGTGHTKRSPEAARTASEAAARRFREDVRQHMGEGYD